MRLMWLGMSDIEHKLNYAMRCNDPSVTFEVDGKRVTRQEYIRVLREMLCE